MNTCQIDAIYDDNCIKYLILENQTYNSIDTLYAREFIELKNIIINSPYELLLKTPKLISKTNVDIQKGAKLTLVDEDGCYND